MNFANIPKSTVIKGFRWTGERIGYPEPDIKGDTFPMTWGEDGDIYAAAGDPLWGETISGLDVQKFTGGPEDYIITKYNHMNDYAGWGGNGPKPTGMICVEGVLYLAFQNFRPGGVTPHSNQSQSGCDAHIVRCVPRWNQWYPSFPAIEKPMFPVYKFGGPSFINFGQNNGGARDGYVYAVSSDQWDNGSNVRLGRVPKDRIADGHYWEFVCAFGADGAPAWHRSLDDAIPVLSIHRFIGLPEMLYLAGIKRYLFLTWRLREDFNPDKGTDLLILDAPEPWGPFTLVHYEEHWQGQEFNPYNPRVPLKWMAADGRSGWMQFSGNWGPAGQAAGYYRSNVRPFTLEV
jgi:hypothetical protein